MLRLGRPVGAYPRLEARLAAIHLGSRDEEEPTVADTGCDECCRVRRQQARSARQAVQREGRR